MTLTALKTAVNKSENVLKTMVLIPLTPGPNDQARKQAFSKV